MSAFVRAGFGDGCTLQNVTASRAMNTIYTNSSGRHILVFVYGGTDAVNKSVFLKVDGAVVWGDWGPTDTVFALVPKGATYECVSTNGWTHIVWNEFR